MTARMEFRLKVTNIACGILECRARERIRYEQLGR